MLRLLLKLLVLTSASSMATAGPRIKQYIDPRSNHSTVILTHGSDAGIAVGDVLTTYRDRRDANRGDQAIETGAVKVIASYSGYAIAEVVESGTDISRAVFPKFSSVMAGDTVKAKPIELAKQQLLLPESSLLYHDLFVDPKANPTSFELSAQGMQLLTELAARYGHTRISKLLIYGYTDDRGPTEANQVESYQRALTVRQYLVQEHGFDESRLLAIGHGELEPAEAKHTPGFEQKNRRILIMPADDSASASDTGMD
jgi:hypothetical protein